MAGGAARVMGEAGRMMGGAARVIGGVGRVMGGVGRVMGGVGLGGAMCRDRRVAAGRAQHDDDRDRNRGQDRGGARPSR